MPRMDHITNILIGLSMLALIVGVAFAALYVVVRFIRWAARR